MAVVVGVAAAVASEKQMSTGSGSVKWPQGVRVFWLA